jgi:hypothetical protein
MNVLEGFSLYLFGAFVLMVLCVFNVLPEYFLGGFVVAGFVGGVTFPFFHAVRQGKKMIAAETSTAPEQETKERLEEPIIAK